MSPRARRSGPAARARSASRDTARHLDQDQSTDSFPPVDASQVIATLPQVLALSDTGRIGARFAHLEHLHQWAAFEKDSNLHHGGEGCSHPGRHAAHGAGGRPD